MCTHVVASLVRHIGMYDLWCLVVHGVGVYRDMSMLCFCYVFDCNTHIHTHTHTHTHTHIHIHITQHTTARHASIHYTHPQIPFCSIWYCPRENVRSLSGNEHHLLAFFRYACQDPIRLKNDILCHHSSYKNPNVAAIVLLKLTTCR